MLALLNCYLGIALLRRSPADLPAGTSGLFVAVAFATTVYVLVGGIGGDVANALSRSTLDLALTAVLLALTLNVFGVPERFCQAFSAFCGSGAIINLAAMPLMWRLASLPEGVDPGAGYILPWLLLMGWMVAVQAQILRLTLQTTRAIALALASGYLVIAFIAFDIVFGA